MLASSFVLLAVCLGLVACGSGSQTESPAKAPSSSESPQEDPDPVNDDSATLDILADQETQILLNGKPIGKTPMTGYKVPPGSHDVTFVDEKNGNRTMAVTVGPNESHIVKSDAPPAIREPKEPEGNSKP